MSGIVVGVDRSDTAYRAAVKAAELAWKTGERLHLVMASPARRPLSRRSGADRVVDDGIARERQFLEGMVQDLGVRNASVAIGGRDPVRALCEEARRLDATVIVVGNRRTQGAGRVLGSVAAALVRAAPCDVLVARTGAEPARRQALGLSSARLFEGCTPKERSAIDRLGTAVQVVAGQTLTREGGVGREFGVLLDGTATVTIDGVPVATLAAGDHFGEMALLGGVGVTRAERTATVVADTDLWVAIASVAEFASLVARFPEVAERLRDGATRRAGAA